MNGEAILPDTSAWVEYLKRTGSAHHLWLKQNVGRTKIVLADLVLYELLKGARSERHSHEISTNLSSLPLVSCTENENLVAAAANYRKLRVLGYTPRGSIDCLIATLCMRNDFALLHRDRDFHAFEQHLGLRVIHP